MMNKKNILGLCALLVLVLGVGLHCYIQSYASQPLSGCYVDFDTSMQAARYPHRFTHYIERRFYDVFKLMYQKNNPARVVAKHPGIPKIIHQIWLGSPFPEKYKAFRDSWLRHHPGWEYKLWTDKDIAELKLYNQALYDMSVNYGEKSDIARYEILYRFGGLYIDTDFECLRAFDHLHECYDFYIGIQPLDTNFVQLGIGLIGSVPGHQLLRTCMSKLAENAAQYVQVIHRTGPIYFTRIFEAVAPLLSDATVALPATYFYPKGYSQTDEPEQVWRKPESFAVHHWEGSWLKKEAQIVRD